MVSTADFVHLHVHTEFSLLDGMIRIPELVDRTAAYQMPAVAITDHGNLFAAVEFYVRAQEKGIKPIVGCEVYVAPTSRHVRDRVVHHLTLLCKNTKGYKNLCRLVSAGYLDGFYHKPRIDLDLLAEYNEGLIALSGCLKGRVAEALREDNPKGATEAAVQLQKIFAPDRFFLELMENGLEDQRRVNLELIALGKRLGIGVVATNDCHYLTREMATAHEVLLCLQTGKTLADEKRMRFATDQFYFCSPGEMKEKFAEVPEAIANTLAIAHRCNFEWDLKAKHFPRFPCVEEIPLDELLTRKVREGFQARLSHFEKTDPNFHHRRREYEERLEYELSVIRAKGFASYFLIVADFVSYARQKGIRVGPGRGSAAGSLVSYCLGITDINPIVYGLLFERFLNPERQSLPDIDVDFCKERREEVLEYVTRQYGGSDYVAQIITFASMQARAAVRDVGRVKGIPYDEVDRIAKLIRESGTLAEAVASEPVLRQQRDHDPKIRNLLETAAMLEGVARHTSAHAAGVVISDLPLTEYLPLYKDQKENKVVVQYDKDCVERVGLIKFDLLGLKTLTHISYCVNLIRQNRQVEINVDDLPLNDPKTFALLAQGDAGGVFQLESSGMKDLLVRLAPEKFEELIAVVALYRPGPLSSGFHDRYIERKHGREPVQYLLPQMEEVLKETYGVIVYQEQVMELAVKLAGFTMEQADALRKAMGKKKSALMKELADKFIAGAQKNGIPAEKAREVYEYMAPFAEYGFNKSHAASYALIAYQTAYLKAHYPCEFLASLMTVNMDLSSDFPHYLKECEERGIVVERPHVNHSSWNFTVKGDRIIFGLGAIKGVGQSAVEAIIEAREKGGPFQSLYDFCSRVVLRRVNRRTIESLIKAGALDDLGGHRAQLMAVLDKAMEMGHAVARERETGQATLFDVFLDEKPADFMADAYPQMPPWTSRELLAHEKDALGYYLTGHPLARCEKMMEQFGIVETTKVPFLPTGQEVLVGGVVTARKEIMDRKKERMAFLTISDLKGSLEVVVFASVYQEARPFLEIDDRPVVVRGRVKVSEDKAKILASEIIPFDQASQRLPLTLHIFVRRPLADQEEVGMLASLLKSYQGKTKVKIHVIIPDHSETVILLPMEYRVLPEEKLLESLRELPGIEDVRVAAA